MTRAVSLKLAATMALDKLRAIVGKTMATAWEDPWADLLVQGTTACRLILDGTAILKATATAMECILSKDTSNRATP